MNWIRETIFIKYMSLLCAVLIMNNLLWPGISYALTSGPSQPEVGGFKPAGVNEMVDVFSGDFSYNIPLFEIGGYPINMSYSSNLSADMEASWVGLGWNLNPGVVNREMRGIPDEFDGDIIAQENNVKDSKTWKVSGKINSEIVGWEFPINLNLSIIHNTFTGYSSGMNIDLPQIFGKENGLSGGLSIGMGTGGLNILPSFSLGGNDEEQKELSLAFDLSSRQGLKEVSYGLNSIGGGFAPGAKPYVPDISNTYSNNSYSFDLELGLAQLFYNPYGGVEASYSIQKISGKQKQLHSYGYQHLDKYDSEELSILDYNRDKYGQKGRYIPDMYMTSLTYDRFHVSAQGIGGIFRMKRGDVGIVSDPTVVDNNDIGDDLGASLELGFGAGGVHIGGDIVINNVKSSEGSWENWNGVDDYIEFDEAQTANYEPWYFQKEGEFVIDPDKDFVDDQINDIPIKVKVNALQAARSIFQDDEGNEYNLNVSTSPKRKKRAYRIELLQPLFVKDKDFCFDNEISVYNESMFETFDLENEIEVANNSLSLLPETTISRDEYPKNHITELNYLSAEGKRFVYGIPAYIHKQKESVFSVNSIPVESDLTGLVSYSDEENSINNGSGKDNYYHSQIVKDFPYAFLLTSVLSPDYSDVDDIEGPSEGDNGSYVNFNYTKISDFKWRVPYWDANHSKGLYAKTHDDKGSIIYGEKDIYYLKTIESKDELAVFYLSERDDARGAVAENAVEGQVSLSQTQRKLDSIQVFSKQDLIRIYNAGTSETPVAKKTVVFLYDYSLCPAVSNNINNGGKLTLREVYFKYGKSGQGRQSSYKFDYSDFNPEYHERCNDRWGNYGKEYSDLNNDGVFDSFSENTSAEYPYVDQHLLTSNPDYEYYADKYANAWVLNEITVPSGAIININYEADDYAFVQNKKAMQMVRVEGFTELNGPEDISTIEIQDIVSKLYEDYNSSMNYLVLHYPDFDALPYMSGGVFHYQECLKDLLQDENGDMMDYLYYKFFVDLKDGNYDYIPGYLKLDPNMDEHYMDSNGNIYLRIQLVEIQDFINNEMINPITQKAISYTKKYYPDYIYEYQDPADNADGSEFLMSLLSIFTGPANDLVGRCRYMINHNNCKDFNETKSWVRLYNVNKKKKGGGSRVSSVIMSDNWSDMTYSPSNQTAPEVSAEYGQTYDYTKIDEKGRVISSGVASYEPLIGGDENPFRMPIAYEERRILAANVEDYIEAPTGESFYPSPNVGYSKVTVRALDNVNINETAVGFQVHEFYTAKDFPTITKKTNKTERIPWPSISILSPWSFSNYAESQGFVVINNDMHGKQKSLAELSADGSVIDKTEYFYKTNSDGTLNSEFKVFDYLNNTISEDLIGYSQDMVLDMKQSKSSVASYKVGPNIDGVILILPVFVPTLYLSYKKNSSRYRGATVSKYIYQCGVLDNIRRTHEGSVVHQKQLLRDKYSAQVLLTGTQNEFNDMIYSFNYPAYWYYEKMGPSFKNLGFVLGDVNIVNGVANLSDEDCNMFVPGDEILLENSSGTFKEWVIDVDYNSNTILIANEQGTLINASNAEIKIMRSGYRNQLGNSIGSLICKTNPMQDVGGVERLVFENILSTNATEYTDIAYMNCDCQNPSGSIFNPFVEGTRGYWRPNKSYYYLDQRVQSTGNSIIDLRDADYNTNIRNDGVFAGSFCPFWLIDENGVSKNSSSPEFSDRWKKSNEVTKYSVRGFEMENVDAIDVYSSAVYGFNGMLPVIVAMNAKLREVAYDGFEDHNFDDCSHDHFSFENEGVIYSTKEYHTGRKSLIVPAQSSVELTKDL